MDIGRQIGDDVGNTLKENMSSIIALFPGKMKPPHKGHFTVVKEACKIADEVVVLISPKYKDEFGPEQSKKIWEQYKRFLPENVTIKISSAPSPVTEIYDIIKDKSNDYLVIYGKGEENRYNSITENTDKYNNVDIVNAGNFENVHSTDLREAIRKRNFDQIQTFLPEGIKVDKFMFNFSLHENKEYLPEGKQLGTLYHFTKVSLVDPIITSDELKGSEIDMTAAFSDPDMEYFRKRGHRGDMAFYISFTRDKLLYKKNPKIKGSSARFVFDGDSLSNNNKFSPFYYYSDEITDENDRFEQSEGEERLILKERRSLKNVKKYIKEVHILLDVIMDSHFLRDAKILNEKNYPFVKFYWKEREVKLDDWLENELPKIEPYADEELYEVYTDDKRGLLNSLVDYCSEQLGINAPDIELIEDENYSQDQHSFGGYSPAEQKIYVVTKERHTADIMRTLAHELVHHKQNVNGELEDGAGKDGDKWENEANSQAAIFMRQFGRNNPEIFE